MIKAAGLVLTVDYKWCRAQPGRYGQDGLLRCRGHPSLENAGVVWGNLSGGRPWSSSCKASPDADCECRP